MYSLIIHSVASTTMQIFTEVLLLCAKHSTRHSDNKGLRALPIVYTLHYYLSDHIDTFPQFSYAISPIQY